MGINNHDFIKTEKYINTMIKVSIKHIINRKSFQDKITNIFLDEMNNYFNELLDEENNLDNNL